MARRLLLSSLGWFALLATPAMAAPETTWAEAVQQGREASQAVLGRTGTETCLQGKMINALIEVSNRCDEGDGNPSSASWQKPTCSVVFSRWLFSIASPKTSSNRPLPSHSN